MKRFYLQLTMKKGKQIEFICNCIKRGEDRGYKSVTLETMMNAKADKPVKKITHHVPPRQMIYTKKQIGLNHEKR